MAKTRIHELAKEMGISSKDLLDKLIELGLSVKNHMSTIPSNEVERIKNMVQSLEKDGKDNGPKQGAKQKEINPKNTAKNDNTKQTKSKENNNKQKMNISNEDRYEQYNNFEKSKTKKESLKSKNPYRAVAGIKPSSWAKKLYKAS